MPNRESRPNVISYRVQFLLPYGFKNLWRDQGGAFTSFESLREAYSPVVLKQVINRVADDHGVSPSTLTRVRIVEKEVNPSTERSKIVPIYYFL